MPSPGRRTTRIHPGLIEVVYTAAEELEALSTIFGGITADLSIDKHGEAFCLALWEFKRKVKSLTKRIQEGNR